MGNVWLIYWGFVLARVFHFGACIWIVGVCAFDRFIIGGNLREDAVWLAAARQMLIIALAISLISGAFWFICVAMGMSGQSLGELVHSDAMIIVWNRTRFGTIWKWRLLLTLVTAVAVIAGFSGKVSRLRSTSASIALLTASAMLGMLAWAGHGQTGRLPAWHLAADVLHLIGAGFWPGSLAPLALILWKSKRRINSESTVWFLKITARFSTMGILIVALLGVTGMVNGYCLIDQSDDLITTAYGLMLIVKVVLYLLMACLGAMNYLRHIPRYETDGAVSPALGKLERNVWIELFLGLLVVCAVAILGLLPPTI